MWHESRQALRALRRRPGFAVVAASTLALGIGATTAMFSVVNGVLLKPLPYPEPDRLVSVWHKAPGMGMEFLNQTAATFFTYREENRTFEAFGLWDETHLTVVGLDEPEEVRSVLVSDGTFGVLGGTPWKGRLFTQDDDVAGAPLAVVVSHEYWRSRLSSDPDVVGRALTIHGQPADVIGVLPRGFQFLNIDPAPGLYVPFRFDRAAIGGVYTFSYQAVARLRPGVTIAQANADVERMIPMTLEKFPGGRGVSAGEMQTMGFGANVIPLKQEIVGDIGNLLWVLCGTVGVVLLIAVANVANLFLVRAESRQQEVAVRAALGAGRAQLARHLLAESLLLGLAGGAAGLLLADAVIQVLKQLAPSGLPRLQEIALDPVVVALAAGLSVAAGAVFGLYPLARAKRLDVVSALKEAGRVVGAGAPRLRMRNALVVTQLALALLLLTGAGLMVRSFAALLDVHPGFERPDEVLALRITVPTGEVRTDPEAALTHEAILRHIAQIPGVESAAISSSVTMDGWDDNNAMYMEDFPLSGDEIPPVHQVKYISEGFFETLGNPVVVGRAISWADIHDRARVVMITENLAREHWGSPTAALGRRISTSHHGPWYEIVGIAGDTHDDGVDRPATPIMYWPMVIADGSGDGAYLPRSLGYAIRSPRIRQVGFLDEVQRAVWSVNPNLPVARVRTLEDLLAQSRARTSFSLVMLAIAAAVAVTLGMVGVYGVISYAVAQRTREFGVRIAFGATSGDVNRLVLKHGAVLATAGIAIGLVGAVALTRSMRALLFGIGPLDVPTFAGVALVLAGVAFVASYLPARRAGRITPVDALRAE